MNHLQNQITDKQTWAIVDTNEGTEAIPIEQLGIVLPADCDNETAEELLDDYLEGSRIFSVATKEGYGARLSAPGYLDCTEWAVFDTQQEATGYLEETYGD
jgi:hypothetical protein